MKKSKAVVQDNIIDIFSPSCLDFKPNYFTIGDILARNIVILAYPTKVKAAWLSRIASIPGVITSIHVVPTDPEKLIQSINRSIGELNSILLNSSNALSKTRAEQAIKDGEELLRKLDLEQQQVFNILVTLLIYAEDIDELNRKTKRIQSMLAAQSMKGRNLMFMQEQGLKTAGPWGQYDKEIFDIAKWNMPSETVAAAFPFTKSGINDGSGILLGKDEEGGICLVDIWSRGGDRTNSNFLILAKPGMGKSYTAKMMILREIMKGTRFYIIDPEREYKQLCEKLGGSWINCGGGEGVINPLQIRTGLEDEDDEEKRDEEKSILKNNKANSPLSLHMQTVRTFFSLYLRDLTDVEKSILEDIIMDVYEKFGITLDTTEIDPNSEFPTIKDLYNELEKRRKKNPDIYERICLLLKKAAVGADQHLWGGQTTVRSEDRITVLDVFDLQNANDEVRRSQYYNVLTWAWTELTKDRTEKTVLVVDEAWLLVDPQTPQALNFLRETSKRIRKYEGGLWVISQNVSDFLDTSVARQGQALLDNPCYKLLLGQGEKDLQALTSLLKLTESEIELLQTAKRGEGLFIAGSQRIKLKIVSAPYEAEYLTGGGR